MNWQKEYDDWVEVTGFVARETSYYYEIQAMLGAAYEEGYEAAMKSARPDLFPKSSNTEHKEG
jgi:hypothetical protein